MNKQSIIVIDDSEPLRSRIKDVIANLTDFEFIGEADNGAEAIDIITSKKPDYITLDINMPKKSGIEVLKSINALENGINVIMITNYADQVFKDKCLKLGASHFLDKSKEFHKLKSILQL